MSTHTTPRVYVACLASYNSGKLHGTWIDATDADAMREAIEAMLKASPEPGAEEWAIHDHDGFYGISVGEYADLDNLAALAANLEEHGEAFAAWVNDGREWDDADGFEEAYQGTWRSEESFAVNLMDDLGELKEDSLAARYFDYAAFTRDLFINDYWSHDGTEGTHVFRRI